MTSVTSSPRSRHCSAASQVMRSWRQPPAVLTPPPDGLKIEGCMDGGGQLGFLRWEQEPDPLTESCLRDRDNVVAVHHGVMPKAVRLPDWDLDGQAAGWRRDRCDGDLC